MLGANRHRGANTSSEFNGAAPAGPVQCQEAALQQKRLPVATVMDLSDLEDPKGAGRMREGLLSIFLSRVRALKLRAFMSHWPPLKCGAEWL